MAFFLFLVYVVFSFVRPGELFPELAPYELMDVATAAALAGALFGRLAGRGPTLRAPQIYLGVLFVLWAAFSVVAGMRWLGGAIPAIATFRGSGLIFLLAVLHIDTLRRFKVTTGLLCVLAVFLAGQSLYSYHTGWRASDFQLRQRLDVDGDLEEVREEMALEQATDDEPPAASAPVIIRVRSLGFLHDPNDLSQALVAILPFLFLALAPGRRLRNALVVWLPASAIFYCIVLTRSRGAIVAMLVALFLVFRRRLGRLGGADGGGRLLLGPGRFRLHGRTRRRHGRLGRRADGGVVGRVADAQGLSRLGGGPGRLHRLPQPRGPQLVRALCGRGWAW